VETDAHEAWDFENRVNRLRNELDEVPRLVGEVSDVMLSIGRSSLSMAPARSSERPLPGGRALALLGPVSEHATEGDDLPHPVTVLRDIADAVREWQGERSVPGESMAAAVEFVKSAARWIVAHEELARWVEARLGQTLGLLRSLVGEVERVEPRTVDPALIEDHMRAMLDEAPGSYRMTPAEADHFWPGISDRIKAHRSRAKVRAREDSKRESREAGVPVRVEPVFFALPDERGRYGADELAEFHRVRGHVRTRRDAEGVSARGVGV
jgi:hypothetical protein